MANQKAQLHDIPLKTMELNMNLYNSTIKPYSGFRNNNSSFYGGVLSPFYVKGSTNLGKNSYVHTDGLIYKIKDDGSFYIENNNRDVRVINNSTAHFLKKETFETSNNSTYPTIIAWFNRNTLSPQQLCASPDGRLAIITPGDEEHPFELMPDGSTLSFRYGNGEKVSVAECWYDAAVPSISYCIVIGNTILAISKTHEIKEFIIYSDRTVECSYGCIKNDNVFAVCCRSATSSKVYEVDASNGLPVITTVTAGVFSIKNSEGTTTKTLNKTLNNMFFNNNGEIIFLDKEIDDAVGTNTRYYKYGYNTEIRTSDHKLLADIPEKGYYEVETAIKDKVTLTVLSSTLDNYCCKAVMGISYSHTAAGQFGSTNDDNTFNSSVYEVATYSETFSYVSLNTTLKKGDLIPTDFSNRSAIGYTDRRTIIETQGNVQADTHVDTTRDEVSYTGNKRMYNVELYDANIRNSYMGVPIDVNGNYLGGTIAKIGDNFRILYHGVENSGPVAMAVSVGTDETTIGTLLCGMSELIYDNPITYGYNENGHSYIIYKDNTSWNKVELTTDADDATLTIANGRYIILNTDLYYNCYDAVEHTLHHYASDWNDRIIFYTNKGMNSSSTDDIASLEGYIKYCEAYVLSSQQDNAEQTSFISSQFPKYLGYLPKSTGQISISTLYGYTPNDQDIDIYYSKESESDLPKYRYSLNSTIKTETKYVNTKLTGSAYINHDQTLLCPSIFATYISGFINSGIIIDNGHSYLQEFQYSTKPIFAIRFVTQLEGVEAAFIIQGQYFVIINGSIYSYDSATASISSVVNIGGMSLIGYTPYQAILWSSTNKTFYTFIGDNTLRVFTQADEISDIYYATYNPNTMSIYVVTDDSVYIIGTDQLIRLNIPGFTKAYPLEFGMALTGEKTIYLSYNNIVDYDILPIELETELYGEGNSIKSVNDCVYIRLFNRGNNSGVVELSCQTLNEGTYSSEKKVFNITSDKWDKANNTLFLRYQPQYQAGTGFSVKIKSPFAIASLQISSNTETVQNSKHNA